MDTSSETKKVLVCILIVVLLLFLIIGPNFGPVPKFLSSRMGLGSSVVFLLLSFIVGFCIIIAAVLSLEGKWGGIWQLLQELGLGKPTRWSAALVGTLVGLLWGALFYMSIRQFAPDTNLMEISALRLLAAVLAAIGALLEDIVTRGFLMNRMAQIRVPNWAQAVLSALIFALYHSIWAFNIFGFVPSLVYGLILSGLFLWGKRSLTPVILGHSLAVLIGEPFATRLIFLAMGS